MNAGAREWKAIPASYKTPAVLLIYSQSSGLLLPIDLLSIDHQHSKRQNICKTTRNETVGNKMYENNNIKTV